MGKRWFGFIFVAAALAASAYYELLLGNPAPGEPFVLDIASIRALAASVPGEKATEVRYEKVLALRFSEALMVAGDPWREFLLQVCSYQLVFPDRTLIVDTAQDRASAKPDFLVANFDDAAYRRMSAAMEKAAQIVITHEHLDHMGGIVAHPHLAQILPAVRLTAEQAANRTGASVVPLPEDLLKNYRPLQYDKALAIAPGVVLIKAPGHTPGSQMVYVQRADGRELLFLGDVSWRMRNVELVRERPLLMTAIIGENRRAVLSQFQALHALRQQESGIVFVPGHEGAVIETLGATGLLKAGFR